MATKEYEVQGGTEVLGHSPGKTFTADLDPDHEARMLERGSIVIVNETAPEASPEETPSPEEVLAAEQKAAEEKAAEEAASGGSPPEGSSPKSGRTRG